MYALGYPIGHAQGGKISYTAEGWSGRRRACPRRVLGGPEDTGEALAAKLMRIWRMRGVCRIRHT